MGTRLTIGDWVFEGADYSIQEDITPLAAGDTQGGVGAVTLTISEPDRYVTYPAHSGLGAMLRWGYGILIDKPFSLLDSNYGVIDGTTTSASITGNGTVSVTATPRLSILNAYNVKADPFTGTLGNLFRYYLSLAGVSAADVTVDPSLDWRLVVAPGWMGELWYYLKALTAAEECEIAFHKGKFMLRKVREVDLARGRDVAVSSTMPVPTLAQAVEVYNQKSEWRANKLVYPPGGWTMETEVLNVNAGEWADYTLETETSLLSIGTPTVMEDMLAGYASSTAHTVVANDGLPVKPAMWAAHGGVVHLSIDPEDSTKIKVRMRGATGIPTKDAEEATNFSLALGSDASGNRYSTLRILGTGVHMERDLLRVSTGVPASATGTEVGVTIDNPFIRTLDHAYRAGLRAAVQYAGTVPTLNVEVTSPLRESGPQIGRVAGARIFDRETARYYRATSASFSPSGVAVQSVDDLTVGDWDEFNDGLTVGQIDDAYADLTLQERSTIGLRR